MFLHHFIDQWSLPTECSATVWSRRRMAAKLRTGTQLAKLRVSCLCGVGAHSPWVRPYPKKSINRAFLNNSNKSRRCWLDQLGGLTPLLNLHHLLDRWIGLRNNHWTINHNKLTQKILNFLNSNPYIFICQHWLRWNYECVITMIYLLRC